MASLVMVVANISINHLPSGPTPTLPSIPTTLMTFYPPKPPTLSMTGFQIQAYNSPLELFDDVFPYLRQREAEANIILPQLLKLRKEKLSRHLINSNRSAEAWSTTGGTNSPSFVQDFWLVLRYNQSVQFVLSCTNGPLGAYPIFIWSAFEVDGLSQSLIGTSMLRLAEELRSQLPSEMSRRVYSVFAPTRLALSFASSWSRLTGKLPLEDPYYDATFAKVSRTTLSTIDTSSRPALYPFELRQAVPEDIPGVAHLCFEFAATSHPFTLDMSSAIQEAKHLIANRYAFVCEVQGQIVCLVAVTRSSERVAAITKVVTHGSWGQQGWAKRLVRFVCQRLLLKENKEEVVLYVARGNGAAESAYHNVGFGGLRGSEPVAHVDAEWIEVGFANTDLGHW